MAKKNILIVEDEPVMLQSMELVLKSKYNIDLATDGSQALHKIFEAQNKGEKFDLLVTDIQMPDMDGLELIDHVNNANYALPTLVITGHGNKRMVIELMRKGCQEYLDKPFRKRDLLSRIDAVLKKEEHRNYEKTVMEKQLNKDKEELHQEIQIYRKHYEDLVQEMQTTVKAYESLIQVNPVTKKLNTDVRYLDEQYLTGDFLTVEDTEHGCDVLISSVSGKDITASYHNIFIKGFFEENARKGKPGNIFFEKLNKALIDSTAHTRQVAAQLLQFNFDDMYVEITSAGHPDVVHLRTDTKQPYQIATPGIALGISDSVHYMSARLTISEKDRLYIISEGLACAYRINKKTAQQEPWTYERLHKSLIAHTDLDFSRSSKQVWHDVKDYCKEDLNETAMLFSLEIPEKEQS